MYFKETVIPEETFKSGAGHAWLKGSGELCGKTPAIGFSGMGYATDEVKMVPVSKKRGALLLIMKMP